MLAACFAYLSTIFYSLGKVGAATYHPYVQLNLGCLGCSDSNLDSYHGPIVYGDDGIFDVPPPPLDASHRDVFATDSQSNDQVSSQKDVLEPPGHSKPEHSTKK